MIIRITLLDLAWFAGVLDLKGRLFLKANDTRKTKQITWAVESKELVVVRRLCDLTGTKPEGRRASPVSEIFRRNCTEHCPEAHTHVDAPIMPTTMRWTATGAGFVIVHHNLKPFLQVDRGYDEVAEQIVKDPAVSARGSTAVMRTVARLDSLGWKLPEPYASSLANWDGVDLSPEGLEAARVAREEKAALKNLAQARAEKELVTSVQ